MISENYDRECALRQLNILEIKDMHGVEKSHNNHGSGNE